MAKKRAGLERDIDAFTEELDELAVVLSNSATFEHASGEQIATMLARQGKIRKRLAHAEGEWLAALVECRNASRRCTGAKILVRR